MKQYEFKVTLREGNDEFWEALEEKRLTGIDDVLEMLREALENFDADVDFVTLTRV
jgi:hypothetical protein